MEIDSFIQRADYLEKEIVILERKIKRYPKGRLACVHNGKYKKWYVRYDGEGHYITKKKNKYLHTMAEKLYMEALLADEKIEYKLLVELLHANGIIKPENEVANLKNCDSRRDNNRRNNKYNKTPSYIGQVQKLLAEDPDYLELFPKFNNPLDDVAPNIRPVHKENLKVPTRAGYMVRSKSEAIIVSLLMDAEIEFYYERPISLAGNWFVPDFTCINRTNKRVYYYEHFGMVDNDEYNKNMYKKLKTYNDNGIYQDINLICTYETSETPLDMRDVQNQIKRFLL